MSHLLMLILSLYKYCRRVSKIFLRITYQKKQFCLLMKTEKKFLKHCYEFPPRAKRYKTFYVRNLKTLIIS